MLSGRETRERTRGSNVRRLVEETHTELDRDFKRTRGGLHFISFLKTGDTGSCLWNDEDNLLERKK